MTLELISNNFIEPWLYGASTSVSAVAIVLAAIFWTMLWGPVGLLLATPLTVCLAVMGRYFPHLAFLDVLLGSAPALSLPERFYQRLLAGDVDENTRIADEYLAERPLAALYDEVVLPALRLAAADAGRRTLTLERRQLVTRGALQVVAELADVLTSPKGADRCPIPKVTTTTSAEARKTLGGTALETRESRTLRMIPPKTSMTTKPIPDPIAITRTLETSVLREELRDAGP